MPQPEQLPENSLRILIVSSTAPQCSEELARGLLDAGHAIVGLEAPGPQVTGDIAALRPAMIVLDAPAGVLAFLSAVLPALRDSGLPVILFTDDATPAAMDASIEAGIAAHIIAGLQAGRVGAIVRLALARHARERGLLAQLDSARGKLAERIVIDRAKGLLMNRQRLSEEDAYQKLRGMAMNKNMKLADLARRLLDVEDLLG